MQGSFSLDDLRLVRAIGEAGTLTGAARRLEVDHSTAFRRLGAVERRLGAHLFERARDGYTPTPAGEAALAAATRILEDLGEASSSCWARAESWVRLPVNRGAAGYAACGMPQTSCHAWKVRVRSAR
jgi:molybdate transport repressor ModE-like protein